jgi:hypothetical protein
MCPPKSWLALKRIKQSLASHHCEKLPQADKGYEGQEHAFCKRFGDARGRDPSIGQVSDNFPQRHHFEPDTDAAATDHYNRAAPPSRR